MKKLYVVTGSRGIGKTTAAVTLAPPDEIDELILLDTEDSASDLTHMGFEHIRMYERLRLEGDMLARLDKGEVPWVSKQGKNALVGYYEYLVHILNEKLTQGQFKYLAIDTISPIEAAMTAAVEDGRRVFGWSGTRAYGRMETEGVRPLYEGLLEAIAQRGVENIIVTSHLKPVWLDNQPVIGKVRPGGRQKVLARLSSAMFWLVPGSDPSGAPAALVLKARIGKVEVKDGHWAIRRVLPARMPVFTWDMVEHYRQNPANLEEPAPGERMNQDERRMISELLTDEQMRLMILSAEQRTAEAGGGLFVEPRKEQTSPVDVLAQDDGGSKTKAQEMIGEQKSNADIVKETGLSLPEVIKLKKELAKE